MRTLVFVLAVVSICLSPFNLDAASDDDAPGGAPEGAVGSNEEELPASHSRGHTLALGVTLDLLPIVMSATAKQFGMVGQIWVGVDRMRLRMVGGKFSSPNWLAAKNGFRDMDTAMGALIFDYTFGKHFDGWWIGTGFELWLNSIGHKDAPGQRTQWNNMVWTIGGGYIYRIIHNFYIEPWVAAHVIMNDPQIAISGKRYTPFPVMGEVSLKFGWFLDL